GLVGRHAAFIPELCPACSLVAEIAEGGTLSSPSPGSNDPPQAGRAAFGASARPTLCAIGNFDGVHRGHVEVLTRARREAEVAGAGPLALTFDPPPAVVLGRGRPAVLTPLDRKIELIGAHVPSIRVVVKTFDEALAQYTPARFAEEVLVRELGAAQVVV